MFRVHVLRPLRDRRNRNSVRLRTLIVGLVVLSSLSLSAEEGMWLPDQIRQMGPELAEYGVAIAPEALADLAGYPLGAMIQAWGCTASFVSPDGLMVTNYHCAASSIQHNSSAGNDLASTGFLARNRSDELWVGPTSRIYITTAIEDVTQRMKGGLDSRLSNSDYYAILDRREKAIIRDCERGGGVRCRVVPIYEGLQYASVRQAEIRDVRLVYVPSRHIGTFGGEEDNFIWPRHAGDFAFFRAYVGKNGLAADYHPENVPFQPRQVLRFSTAGIDPGDSVVVPGYPARTLRYKSSAEVQKMARSYYPRASRYMRDYLAILRAVGAESEETRIRLAPAVFTFENALRATEGAAEAIERTGLLHRREAEERVLTDFLRERDRREQDVVEQLAELAESAWQTDARDSVAHWMLRVSPFLNQALQIYRFSLERPKKDADRQWGYQERDLPRIETLIERSQKSLSVRADRAGLEYFLREAVALPDSQRIEAVDKALARTGETDSGRAIATLLDTFYSKTRMGELEERRSMLSETTAALDARADPFLQFAASLIPQMTEKERTDQARYAAASRLRPRYMEAIMALRGGRIPPDANGTIRISIGRVKGYSPRDGVIYGSQTTLEGLLEKNRNEDPFLVPPALVEAARHSRKSRWVDGELGNVPVNFLTTADLAAGNSGSPTLNTEGEIVGLLFDGNYEAMASDFSYDPLLTRSIHVDARYMFWVMENVDGATALLSEIGIPER
jgi:hypothetical protein